MTRCLPVQSTSATGFLGSATNVPMMGPRRRGGFDLWLVESPVAVKEVVESRRRIDRGCVMVAGGGRSSSVVSPSSAIVC